MAIKKFLLLFIFIILLTVNSACSGVIRINPEKLNLNKAYELTAALNYGELNASAVFERKNTGVWDIKLLEPFALEGIVLRYKDGEIIVGYDGVNTGFMDSGDSGNDNAVYLLVIESLENAFRGEAREIISSKEEIVVSGQSLPAGKRSRETDSYELVLNKDCVPVSLKISAPNSVTAVFSGVKITEITQVFNDDDFYGISPADINTADNDISDIIIVD